MLLSTMTVVSVMKAGELFLSGCMVGAGAYQSIKEATRKAK